MENKEETEKSNCVDETKTLEMNTQDKQIKWLIDEMFEKKSAEYVKTFWTLAEMQIKHNQELKELKDNFESFKKKAEKVTFRKSGSYMVTAQDAFEDLLSNVK